jgi:hypothetical protein
LTQKYTPSDIHPYTVDGKYPYVLLMAVNAEKLVGNRSLARHESGLYCDSFDGSAVGRRSIGIGETRAIELRQWYE